MTDSQLTIAYGLLAFITLGILNAVIFAVFKNKKHYYKEHNCDSTCEQCAFKCKKDD